MNDGLPELEGPLEYISGRIRTRFASWALNSSRNATKPCPQMAVFPHDYLGRHVILEGVYEWRELRAISELVRRERLGETVCLDVGSHIGNHALALSRMFQRVVGFEPNPTLAGLAHINCKVAGRDNIRIHPVGLGESDQLLGFAQTDSRNFGTGTFQTGSAGETAETLMLRVVAGDAFLAAEESGLCDGTERIGMIKCDVEGFERQVFAGLSRTIAKHRPVIVFESNFGREGRGVQKFLSSIGYTFLYRIAQTGDRYGRVGRVLTRCLVGHNCWTEPIDVVPDRRSNLILSTKSLASH